MQPSRLALHVLAGQGRKFFYRRPDRGVILENPERYPCVANFYDVVACKVADYGIALRRLLNRRRS